MKKKQVCLLIAALVSICMVVCLVSTGIGVLGAVRSGDDVPLGMVMLSLVTVVCTVMIWRGVREME